jgi:hypothetical protein
MLGIWYESVVLQVHYDFSTAGFLGPEGLVRSGEGANLRADARRLNKSAIRQLKVFMFISAL